MQPATKKANITILVVDDDRDIVQTIKGNLELDGYEVLTAPDGRSALDMAKAHRPGLIILDLNLPDIDGIRVCQIMRREFDFPIIMLTARDGLSDRVLGLECGADDYMVKPFSSLELSARIKAILKRVERSVVKDHWEIRDLSVNFRTRRVFVGGEEIKLTKTEFELLEFFISNANEVLNRDFIQAHVWRDSQLYSYSRAIDVHVQRLRKKIEADLENPRFIITVAGVGYKFKTD
ncbi:MAG: response regulator transcription factor [Syntrophobacter sp.]